MTEVQEMLLELLTDIDTICKRENLKYYLCAETAHAAFMKNAFYPNCCEASVAMTADDVLKFISAVEKENRADRIVDSMANNKKYSDFSVRYGNPNTMMMPLLYNNKGALPCIAVKINIIRYKPKQKSKFYKHSKLFWKKAHTPLAECKNLFLWLSVAFAHAVKKIFGEAKMSRMLFKKWCAIFSANKNTKKVAICSKKYIFNADLLSCDDTIEFEAKQFNIFGYLDTYLRTAYGSSFKKIKTQYIKNSSDWLISHCVSYKKYIERTKELKIKFSTIKKNKKKLDKLNKKVTAYNKIIDGYYAIVRRTEERFAMYEMYMPVKKLLLKLHSEGRYEELNEILKPYRSALWYCYRKGLGLCFDKEIFEITMDILRMEGSYTYVNKLRMMVPEQHWEPMVVTDYKGELVEITDISELLPEYSSNEEVLSK